jgi:Ca-activated chloride channel family protein
VHADCFAGVPLVLTGRYRGRPAGTAALAATDDLGGAWSSGVTCRVAADAHLAPVWARGHLRDLEDRYAVTGGSHLADRIVQTSLSFGVLSRFTAFVAVDRSEATDSTAPTRVLQPVELPSGWQDTALPLTAAPMARMRKAAVPASYVEMELGSPEAMPAPPPSSAPPSGFSGPPPTHASEVLSAAGTAGGSDVSHTTLDGYAARRDALADDLRVAVEAADVERARQLLRELRELRDDLASVGLAEPALQDLQRLIDALTDWAAAPTAATTDGVTAALEALGPMAGAGRPPRHRSQFWR